MESNIFSQLERQSSSLLSLFKNKKNPEILNISGQAPSPSKNFYQLIMNNKLIILRWWEISRRSTSDSRCPGETKVSYNDFVYDELIQRKFYNFKYSLLNTGSSLVKVQK